MDAEAVCFQLRTQEEGPAREAGEDTSSTNNLH